MAVNDDPEAMTDERARQIMLFMGKDRAGFTLNPMRGTAGTFYRDNRAEDIDLLCREIITERGEAAIIHELSESNER
ncbi:MAG TPA: hypothetical protein VJ851_00870 [Jatrophihabitans sp.]|nr:hypothetical protein [Jatrophihabitans sp.]